MARQTTLTSNRNEKRLCGDRLQAKLLKEVYRVEMGPFVPWLQHGTWCT